MDNNYRVNLLDYTNLPVLSHSLLVSTARSCMFLSCFSEITPYQDEIQKDRVSINLAKKHLITGMDQIIVESFMLICSRDASNADSQTVAFPHPRHVD